jgi:DNA-binding LacI/PurR family transcriptional regulator
MTLQEVASEAGVSIATVSRMLNNLSVRPDSRKKIEDALARLDPTGALVTRGPNSKQSKAIGVLNPSISNSYFMEIDEAIEHRLSEEGFMMFLCSTGDNYSHERKRLNDMLSRKVDGIIIIDPYNENYTSGFLQSIARKLPLALVHSNESIHDLNSVIIDQALAMLKVMEMLWGLGHRDIAFLRASAGYSYDIKQRVWEDYLRRNGIAAKPGRIINVDGERRSFEEVLRSAEEKIFSALSEEGHPTAIFACNDTMALGSLHATQRLGIRVPEDVSIVGYDNTFLAIGAGTPITSVDMKMNSLGNAAVDLLFHAMNGRDPEPRRILIKPELILRASTGIAKR